ncbi:Hypothetical predicted protein, partial [Olea europaea subsp. europaea]
MEIVKNWTQEVKSKLGNLYLCAPPSMVQDPPLPMLAAKDNQNNLLPLLPENFDWTSPIVSFCFTSAVGMAMLPPTQRETLPMIFYCVLVILAFSTMWVRKIYTAQVSTLGQEDGTGWNIVDCHSFLF